MKAEIFKYLQKNFSQDPIVIDRLLVSSFIFQNKIEIKKNKLIKEYLIRVEDGKEYEGLINFLRISNEYVTEFNFERLIQLFEFVVSPSDRIVTGAVYTPKHIREYITNNAFLLSHLSNKDVKVLDPACGVGGFLCSTAIYLKQMTKKSYKEIYEENIYGLDIKGYSINRTKLLLSLLSISKGEDPEEINFNLFEGDALSFKWEENLSNFAEFDIVVGNPPYVCSRNIDKKSKELLSKWSVCSTGHPDLYIPFFQIGLENLKDDGVLGFITMNTFFRSVNGRALREYFHRSGYKFKIIDFGGNQVFHSKSTYTCICFIVKQKSDYLEYVKTDVDELVSNNSIQFGKVNYSNLNFKEGWVLSNHETISKIENTGRPFGDLYKTRNGIATLKNSIYIFDPIDEDDDFYYLKNGAIFKVEKGLCKDIVNPNKLTKVDDINLIKQKVVFPYRLINGDAQLIDEMEFRNHFPSAYYYLNSKREILTTRDKGNGNYENWYAYGRKQSLDKLKYKLFFPHIVDDLPNFVINTNDELLFYNGLAVIGNNIKELKILKKIMSSGVFWYYIQSTSKPYSSGFFSLSRNYIKNFGVYEFSEKDKEFILNENDKNELNKFFLKKYEIEI